MRLAPLVLVLAVGGLPACAGSESDFLSDPLPSTASAPTTVPDTPVATPAIASTEPITTPEPPTTLPAPAPAQPATTVPAGPPTELEIRAVLDPLFAGWNVCSYEPATCEPAGFAVADSPFAVSIEDTAREWVAAGKYLEPRIGTAYSVESVLVLAPDLVKVTLCDVDYNWIREVNETPQHDDDVVLDDRVIAFRVETTYQGAPGEQLLLEFNRLASWPREASCPAA